MVTLPAEGRWTLRTLSDDDAGPALAFLRRDPLINVYLISRLLEERFVSATQIVEVGYGGDIVMIASMATNIVMAADPDSPTDVVDAAAAILSERVRTRMLPVRAILSPAYLVDAAPTILSARVRTRMLPVRAIISPAYLVDALWKHPCPHALGKDGRRGV